MANTKARTKLSPTAQVALRTLAENPDWQLVTGHRRLDGQDEPVWGAWIRNYYAPTLTTTVPVPVVRTMLRGGWLTQVDRWVSSTTFQATADGGATIQSITTLYRPNMERLANME